MSDRDEILKMFMAGSDGEAWQEKFARLGPEETIAFVRRVHKAFANDPDAFPEIPPEVIGQIAALLEAYERAARDARIADQNLKLVQAVRERTIDAMLNAADDQTKGH
jgi:hypothetical protein